MYSRRAGAQPNLSQDAVLPFFFLFSVARLFLSFFRNKAIFIPRNNDRPGMLPAKRAEAQPNLESTRAAQLHFFFLFPSV